MLRPITSESISTKIDTGLKGSFLFKNQFYGFLALNEGEFQQALKLAVEANKTIEGHTSEKRKSPHVLTLQADVNSLYG